MTLPAVPLQVVTGRITERAQQERQPLIAEVEIIATCNFRCQHCYIAPCAEREDVMPVERARIIFHKLADAGVLRMLLTGGEVFTHKQFREIYLLAKRLGFFITINTNGYLIGRRWADFLAEWPPAQVSISLYGLSDEHYQRITGIPNAFKRVDRAISLLSEREIRMELKCPAMTLTEDLLPGMKEYAEARGLRFRFDSVISPQEKGDVGPLQLQLSPKAVVDLEERMRPGGSGYEGFVARFPEIKASDRVYRCGAGRMSLAVNVHGGVMTCLTSRNVVGDLVGQSFDEIWTSLGNKVALRFPPNHPCGTCRLREMCISCPALAEQVTKDPRGYVQQYCRITHLRAFRLGLHPTGIPRTVEFGIPQGVATPSPAASRNLPVLN